MDPVIKDDIITAKPAEQIGVVVVIDNDCQSKTNESDASEKEVVIVELDVEMEKTDTVEVNQADNSCSTSSCQLEDNKNDTCEKEIEIIELDSSTEKTKETSAQEATIDSVDIVDQVVHVNKETEQKDDEDVNARVQQAVATVQANDQNKVSSLGAIAMEYGDSDSETENNSPAKDTNNHEIESSTDTTAKVPEMQNYRSQNVESIISSEDDDDDSDSDSSDSSSDSSTPVRSEDEDSDASASKGKGTGPRKQRESKLKCEWDDLPPIEELKISVPEVLCDPLGEVAWMVEQLVIVKPKSGKPTLNLDTVLFIDRGRRALGKIFDVFGPVTDPHYSVRFNSTDHIKECDILVGMTVYYCPNTEYTSLVFLHELTKMKGTDLNADGEPPDFSDDEEERLYYENLRKQQAKNKNDSGAPCKKPRNSNPAAGWQSNHPWNRNKQRRDGQISKRQNKRNHPGPHGGQAYNAWDPYFYQNCWPAAPFRYNEPYARMQPLQYVAPNGNTSDQPAQNTQNYADSGVPMRPRVPVVPNRFPPAFPPFRHPGMQWQTQPQVRTGAPWASLPRSPLPPPPPPPQSDDS